MNQKKRINQILIIVVLCLLILYAGIHMNIGAKSVDEESLMGVKMFLMNQTEHMYLSGFSYLADGGTASKCEPYIESMRYLSPIVSYVEKHSAAETDVEDRETYEWILARQANDENMVDENGNLIGKELKEAGSPAVDISLEQLKDFEYLIDHFYTVDSSTSVDPGLVNAEKLLSKDMKLHTEKNGPKVLIYHTHSQEAFADSAAGDVNGTIMGMGDYLAKLLNERYGIETMHHTGVYDLIDGKLDRSKAYQLAEPQIKNVLKENPGIEVVIDLHRDGVGKDRHLVTEINGKPTAQIMFFNGMSRTRANGNIAYLANPYIEDNLAFSLQMQIAAAKAHPGFTRHIYLKSYRYNMHLVPKCLLIEAGAQTNTVEEMRNAMEILAETLDGVLTD